MILDTVPFSRKKTVEQAKAKKKKKDKADTAQKTWWQCRSKWYAPR